MWRGCSWRHVGAECSLSSGSIVLLPLSLSFDGSGLVAKYEIEASDVAWTDSFGVYALGACRSYFIALKTKSADCFVELFVFVYVLP